MALLVGSILGQGHIPKVCGFAGGIQSVFDISLSLPLFLPKPLKINKKKKIRKKILASTFAHNYSHTYLQISTTYAHFNHVTGL